MLLESYPGARLGVGLGGADSGPCNDGRLCYIWFQPHHSLAMWSQERTSPELLAPPSLLANGGVKAEPAASDCYTSNKNLSAHWGRGTTLHMFMPLKRYIYYTHTHIYICLIYVFPVAQW